MPKAKSSKKTEPQVFNSNIVEIVSCLNSFREDVVMPKQTFGGPNDLESCAYMMIMVDSRISAQESQRKNLNQKSEYEKMLGNKQTNKQEKKKKKKR